MDSIFLRGEVQIISDIFLAQDFTSLQTLGSVSSQILSLAGKYPPPPPGDSNQIHKRNDC